MKVLQKTLLTFLLLSLAFQLYAKVKTVSISAPDQQTKVEFAVNRQGALQYRIYSFGQKPLHGQH